ncbi:MAG: Mur ligase family protein, partial [Verrucomicrobia bacterium]|nr:Mur ligase family protein [Verrucomicrobiota bacterium]
MILSDLISGLSRVTATGPLDTQVSALTASSREVAPGMLFAAIRGTSIDGHRFIAEALAAGAGVIVAESAPPPDLDRAVAWLHVPDSREALAMLASTLAGHPWQDMAVAGVTGTNGKTTTVFLIHHIMKTVWHRAGLLGTILVDDGETAEPAQHTTPGAIELTALLGRMRDHGCRGVALEVSSHGIHQKRVSAIGFDTCVFTNLTQDHLDYHGSLDAYYQA